MSDEETIERLTAEANLRKAIADAQRAEAQAAKARQEARGVAPPLVGGRTTADERSGYVATLAAYEAMARTAGDIARAVEGQHRPGEALRVLIVDTLDVSLADLQLVQVTSQLEYWRAELEARTEAVEQALAQPSDRARFDALSLLVAGSAVAQAAGAAAGVAGLAGDVLGYFRTDYSVQGQPMGLSTAALQALVAGRIDRQKCTVFLPAFHRAQAAGAMPVMEKLDDCLRRRDRLKAEAARLKALLSRSKGRGQPAEAQDDGKALGRGEGAEGTARAQAGGLEAVWKEADLAISGFAGFHEAVASVPKGGGLSPLAAAAMRQYLDGMGITHLLYLAVTSGGGETVVGQGLFHSGKAGYLGGCVVSYVLARCTGEIVAADTLLGRSRARYSLGDNQLSGPGPA